MNSFIKLVRLLAKYICYNLRLQQGLGLFHASFFMHFSVGAEFRGTFKPWSIDLSHENVQDDFTKNLFVHLTDPNGNGFRFGHSKAEYI